MIEHMMMIVRKWRSDPVTQGWGMHELLPCHSPAIVLPCLAPPAPHPNHHHHQLPLQSTTTTPNPPNRPPSNYLGNSAPPMFLPLYPPMPYLPVDHCCCTPIVLGLMITVPTLMFLPEMLVFVKVNFISPIEKQKETIINKALPKSSSFIKGLL